MVVKDGILIKDIFGATFFQKNSVCWNGISDKISHLSEDEFTRDGVEPYGKPRLGQM